MILGLCSVTFAKDEIEDIMPLAQGNSLKTIEWSARDHVKPGDMAAAVLARKKCRHAQMLEVSYGSYYKAGCPEADQTAPFELVLHTAEALKATQIRVWAGDAPSAEVTEDQFQAMVADLQRITTEAAKHNITIILEYHANTYTDDPMAALRLLEAVNHSRLFISWQPPVGATLEQNQQAIALLGRYIDTVHVFAWDDDGNRLPLQDQQDLWQTYVEALRNAGFRHERYLLEFVQNDDFIQFARDVSTLREIVGHDFL